MEDEDDIFGDGFDFPEACVKGQTPTTAPSRTTETVAVARRMGKIPTTGDDVPVDDFESECGQACVGGDGVDYGDNVDDVCTRS